MKELKERAEDYFKGNPGTTELFGTSDGTLFLQKQHATAHASGLEDKEVIPLTPSSVAGEKSAPAAKAPAAPKAAKAPAAKKATTTKAKATAKPAEGSEDKTPETEK